MAFSHLDLKSVQIFLARVTFLKKIYGDRRDLPVPMYVRELILVFVSIRDNCPPNRHNSNYRMFTVFVNRIIN